MSIRKDGKRNKNSVNLKDYIRGKRHGKEANRLEREAMKDPFLQDAIDGYDTVEGDHASAIEQLEKQLTQPRKHVNKSEKQFTPLEKHVDKPKKRVNQWVWIGAAAALLLLLIGIPYLLFQPDRSAEPIIASMRPSLDAEIPEGEIAAPLLTADSLLVADRSTRETEALPHEPVSRQIIQSEQVDKHDTTREADRTIPQPPVSRALAGRVSGTAVSESARESSARITRLSTDERDHLLVSGRVVDETGEPLIGATISLKDSESIIGTVTDMEGKFRLIVPKDEEGKLVASFIGMNDAPIPLKENAGEITLKSDDLALSEVVVTGYGTQKKSITTGAVMTVKKKFGETEFKEYFFEHYDTTLCEGQPIFFTVEFFIDAKGRPTGIHIKENSCPGLETEIKRLLLGSPLWSAIDKKMELKIEIP
ncbi:MAG: hypothetical protein GX371_10790 [Bacteroidales bacterium]|nr:hypothetical protein [Bacteroidales bacterium]